MLRALPCFALLVALIAPAHADEYKLRDEARAAIAAAINQFDATAFAAHAGKDLALSSMWFDTASCRKRFANAHVKAKDLPALVACLAPLKMDARTLLVRYGPDVVVNLNYEIADGTARLISMTGDATLDLINPEVWINAFEAHRKEGTKSISLDDKASAELADLDLKGVVYRVCVGAKGTVVSTKVFEVPARGPTAQQITAATKTWKFDPFKVRGKPTTACATSTVKPTP